MAEQGLKPVPTATGAFVALRPNISSTAQSGKPETVTGNSVPLPERPAPDMEAFARVLDIASQNIGRDLRFEVDMESGSSVILVLDRETGDVIRQIPPEKAVVYLSGSGTVQLQLYNEVV